MGGETFTLRNISGIQTILSYYVKPGKIIEVEEEDSLPQTLIYEEDIPVKELLHEKSRRAFYFLDQSKTQNKYWGNLIDLTRGGPLPTRTSTLCWWCRNSFSTSPVGCPLKYHSHKSKGVQKERVEEKLREAGYQGSTNDFFETEGIFCSFPCVKAYIADNEGKVKYKESSTLLTLLHYTLYGQQDPTPTAPSWKVLKEYGGHLTIQEFRASFGKLEYQETVNVRRPYMFCSSQYLSEMKIWPYSRKQS